MEMLRARNLRPAVSRRTTALLAAVATASILSTSVNAAYTSAFDLSVIPAPPPAPVSTYSWPVAANWTATLGSTATSYPDSTSLANIPATYGANNITLDGTQTIYGLSVFAPLASIAPGTSGKFVLLSKDSTLDSANAFAPAMYLDSGAGGSLALSANVVLGNTDPGGTVNMTFVMNNSKMNFTGGVTQTATNTKYGVTITGTILAIRAMIIAP